MSYRDKGNRIRGEGDKKMRIIKGWIPTAILTVTMLFGATAANAGIIYGGYAPTPTQDPCGTQTANSTGIIYGGLTGIIYGGFTGIIYGGYTGIIYGGLASSTTTSCGIIVTDSAKQTDRTGIIVTD
jgi:hypothetical protein